MEQTDSGRREQCCELRWEKIRIGCYHVSNAKLKN